MSTSGKLEKHQLPEPERNNESKLDSEIELCRVGWQVNDKGFFAFYNSQKMQSTLTLLFCFFLAASVEGGAFRVRAKSPLNAFSHLLNFS